MMEWRDEGIVLAVRPHGESAAIAEIFTRDQGRHLGVVRGGTSRRMAPHLQPGTQVAVVWKARLGGQLGTFSLEPLRSRGLLLGEPLALAGLLSLCTLLARALPERAPHAALWLHSVAMLDRMAQPGWPAAYLEWEMALLQEIGFGLDLSACAVTGSRQDLRFVSPKSGRAVSGAGAGDWAERLLPLPPGLAEGLPLTGPALLQGLALTGHFLAREWAAEGRGPALPEARNRLLDRLARLA